MSGTPDSGVGEIFACGIQNLGKVCMWNPASWALESVVDLELSGILQTIEIRNPNSTDKESGPPVPGIPKPQRPQQGNENPGLGWITSHGAKLAGRWETKH